MDPQALMALQADAQPSIACVEFLIEQSALCSRRSRRTARPHGIAAAFEEEEGLDASDEPTDPTNPTGPTQRPGFDGGEGVPSADAFAAMDLNGDGKVDRGVSRVAQDADVEAAFGPGRGRRPLPGGAASAASGSARGLSPAAAAVRISAARVRVERGVVQRGVVQRRARVARAQEGAGRGGRPRRRWPDATR